MDPVYNALQKWVDLLGYEPTEDHFSGWGGHDAQMTYKDLRDMQKLDPSGVTVSMMLRAFLENRMNNTSFTVQSMVDDPEKYLAEMQKTKALQEALADEHIVRGVKTFQDGLLEAVQTYGWASPKVREVINDPYQLGWIRRDALYAMNRLREYQFLQGEETTDGSKFNPFVYEFWNVNSLLNLTLMQSEDGVSLCLVRDALALHSFFCFVIRNGFTVTVLTDRPDWKHPEQKHMSRRPDRELRKRAAKYRFPYELLDIKATSDGKRLYAAERSGLVPYQSEFIRLKPIKELDPDTILWLTIMFAEMRTKYWLQKHRTKQLAYTGEMLVKPERMLQGVQLPAVRNGYKPLELPEITTDDVTTEATKDQWGRKSVGHNQWMEERYGKEVPPKDLNLVMLPMVLEKDTWGEMVPVRRELGTFDITDFGTAEEMTKDRLWFARYNKAKRMQQAAVKEFEERQEEIRRWFRDAVLRNIDPLMEAIAAGKFVTLGQGQNPGKDFDDNFDQSYESPKDIMFIWDDQSEDAKGEFSFMYNPPSGDTFNAVFLHAGERTSGSRWDFTCYKCTKSRARMKAVFKPTTAQALADLIGKSVEDLPEIIQHWRDEDPYSGNPILDRLDPIDWVAEDPWKKAHFRVMFMFCKRCLKSMQTKYKKGASRG